MAYSGFSGGMMFNFGYGFSGKYQLFDDNGNSLGTFKRTGVREGMGGALKVGFGKHLRVGVEGFVSTMNHSGNGSYARLGGGGVLMDSKWDIDRWTLFVGGSFGGVTARHLDIVNDQHDEYQVTRSSFRKYSFLSLDPFLGFEFAMTRKVHLLFQMDYLFNLTTPRPDAVQGPRFFVGFMFCH